MTSVIFEVKFNNLVNLISMVMGPFSIEFMRMMEAG